MKVTQLQIDNFRHLENLNFDFTYQSGTKKGQPLEKICFIGQSATGKTSILELIIDFFNKGSSTKNKATISFSSDEENKISFSIGVAGFTNLDRSKSLGDYGKTKLLYFSSNQLSDKNFDHISKIKKLTEFEITTNEDLNRINLTEKISNVNMKRFFEFTGDTDSNIWMTILNEISDFRDKLTQKGSDLITKGLHQDFTRLGKEMEKWKKDNPNPLENLAIKCLNPILKKLSLEVDLADTSSLVPLKPINNENAIPSNGLSTGTKQLILNALPLFKLPTDNGIIIIDEPERSLYPDVQMELIPFYQSLAPKAQFIVATHSPFIAASFEQEERFILYFDEKGKVQVKNGVSPIGDDPNDILKNDFGLKSLMNDSGIKAYKNYLDLKQQMASEKDEKKKKELLKKVVSLGDKYMF